MAWTHHRPGRLAAHLAGTATAWLRRHRTSRQLLELDDAALKDIGLHRSEIPSIVWSRNADSSRRLR